MAEINVTPFVDVMLVLLIVFMVAAPLLTVGVPVDLPKSQGSEIRREGEPLTVSVNSEGKIYLQDTEVSLDELQARLEAIAKERGGKEETIFVRGDRNTNYGELMRAMGRIAAAGYKKLSLVTEMERNR
jgi:biopolymer transport protein TolR